MHAFGATLYIWLCLIVFLFFNGPGRILFLLGLGWLCASFGVVLAFPDSWRHYRDFDTVRSVRDTLRSLDPAQRHKAVQIVALALLLFVLLLPVELCLWVLRRLGHLPRAQAPAQELGRALRSAVAKRPAP